MCHVRCIAVLRFIVLPLALNNKDSFASLTWCALKGGNTLFLEMSKPFFCCYLRTATQEAIVSSFMKQSLEKIEDTLYQWHWRLWQRWYGRCQHPPCQTPSWHNLGEKKAISHFMPVNNIPCGTKWRGQAIQHALPKSPASLPIWRDSNSDARDSTHKFVTLSSLLLSLRESWFLLAISPILPWVYLFLWPCAFSLHIIACGDDLSKFNEQDLGRYKPYPYFGIIGRIAWSKNVREERDAPQQLRLGSMIPWTQHLYYQKYTRGI